MTKVQLFSPSQEVGHNYVEGAYWPYNLLSLSNFVRKRVPNTTVEIFDSAIIEDMAKRHEYLTGQIDQQAVMGITANSLNYSSVLKLAQEAKRKGVSKVVVGGPHATAVGKLILQKRPEVDFVIQGEGEEGLLGIVNNSPLEEIPNLIYRTENGDVKANPTATKNIGLHEYPDLSDFPIEKYFDKHRELLPDLPDRTALFFTHFGCQWRDRTGGCSICAIPLSYDRLPPEVVWDRIRELRNNWGIEGIKDYGDDFISDPKWLKQLLKVRPSDLEETVFSGVYVSPRAVSETSANILKELNVKLAFMGLESGNDKILKLMNKGCTVTQNYIATKRLSDRGITVLASYVLGLEGEDDKTLQDTYNLARKVADLPNVKMTQTGMILMFPGSKNYQRLVGKHPEFGETDEFDATKTRKVWLKDFCNFSIDVDGISHKMEEMCAEMSKWSKLQNYLGYDLPKGK